MNEKKIQIARLAAGGFGHRNAGCQCAGGIAYYEPRFFQDFQDERDFFAYRLVVGK